MESDKNHKHPHAENAEIAKEVKKKQDLKFKTPKVILFEMVSSAPFAP